MTKDLIESFCLEIISNASQIKNSKEKLLSYNYATKASLKLLDSLCIITEICEQYTKSVYSEIDWSQPKIINNQLSSLRHIKRILEILSSHLDYLEHSRIDSPSFGLTSPFERIAKQIVPEADIILYQQWEYNYTIQISDIRAYLFENFVEPLKFSIDLSLYEKAKNDLSKPIFLISFPFLEKENIFQFSLLGHEIGHLYAAKILASSPMNTLEDLLTESFQQFAQKPDFNLPDFIDYFKKIWIRLFEELMSDAVGTVLFGPAMMFSIVEFAQHYDLDMIPSNDNSYYPPWRTRLRLTANMLTSDLNQLTHFYQHGSLVQNEKIQNRIEDINTIINDTKDIQALQSLTEFQEVVNLIFTNVYDYILSLKEQIYEDFNQKNFLHKDFFTRVNQLASRLNAGIPPNTTNDLNQNANASLCEILNAAWLERISWESEIFTFQGSFNEKALLMRKKLNDLTNKAIEFSDLQINYMEKSKQ